MDCPQADLQVICSQGEVLPQPNELFQELLQSLPNRKNILSNNMLLYLYDGIWLNEPCLEAVIAFQQNFQAQDSDIILVTAPKSGTTWLKSLVFTITRRFQYKISDENHPLVTTNPHDLVPFIEYPVYPHNPAATGTPRLIATHLQYTLLPESIKTCKCKIIYLCRNPRDTFVSRWHFAHKIMSKLDPSCQFPSPEESLEKFCEGVLLFGPFWEQILQFWKLCNERPEKVLFLKYEELKGDIIGQCKKMADFMNCSFSSEEENQGVIKNIAKLCSFEHLSNLEVNKQTEVRNDPRVDNGWYFRKGEIGDWKNLITPSMAEKLDQLIEQKLQGSGLKLN